MGSAGSVNAIAYGQVHVFGVSRTDLQVEVAVNGAITHGHGQVHVFGVSGADLQGLEKGSFRSEDDVPLTAPPGWEGIWEWQLQKHES